MKTQIRILLIALTLGVDIIVAGAQGTAFTYQGRLNDGANPATGIYDLRFAIYDSTNNPGVLIAGPVTNAATSVSNGLFTVALDFGSGVFNGAPRFLEIAVRTNGGVSFVALIPRQALTATPYAIFANSASNLVGSLSPSQLSGIYSNPVNFNNGADSFSGTFIGQFFGSSFTGGNFTGNFLGTGSGLYDVWHTAGNSGTTPASFLGTTDNQPLILKVYGQETMRYEASPETPNIIGGWSGNSVQSNLTGVTIGGGGSPFPFAGNPQPNVIANNGFYGVIAGGYNNTVTNYGGNVLGGSVNLSGGNFATIGGGQFHTNLGNYAVIAGGFNNFIGPNAFDSVIGGGYVNSNLMYYSVIGGGALNVVTTNISGGGFQPFYSVIGGGYANVADSGWTVIAGGYFNTNRGVSGFIGSGDDNIVNNNYSSIVGGVFNEVGGIGSFVGGGGYDGFSVQGNKADAGGSSIVGGIGNIIYATAGESFIGGGYYNSIQTNAGNSVIGGGLFNNIQTNADQSVIAGGNANNIEPFSRESFIGSGFANDIQPGAITAFIGGGNHNTNGAGNSVIVGGNNNFVQLGAGGSFVGGGAANTAAGFLSTSVGGQGNAAFANNSTMVGGLFNTNFGVLSFIGGGDNNFSAGFGSVIAGGESNRTAGAFAMAAGYHAGALQDGTFVWADFSPANFNSTFSNQFLIRAQGGVGINTNNPQAALHVVGNIIADNFVGSGANLNGLNASQLTGTVADARLTSNVALLNRDPQTFTGANTFSGNTFLNGFVGFGATASPIGSANFVMSQTTVGNNFGGMYINTTSATGRPFYGYAQNGGSTTYHYVDGGDANKWKLHVSIGDAMLVTQTGFVGIANSNPTNFLMVANARCDGNTWINASDRNLKENFAAINGQEILEKVAHLPITFWNYKADATSVHLGPVAQDFRAAFQLGADDRSITTVDESGVALAAIQGLNQKLEAKEAKINDLEKRLNKLEQLLAAKVADNR